jgi:hypothetical protein
MVRVQDLIQTSGRSEGLLGTAGAAVRRCYGHLFRGAPHRRRVREQGVRDLGFRLDRGVKISEFVCFRANGPLDHPGRMN